MTVDTTWPDAQHGVHDQKPERHERYEVVELVGTAHGHTQQHHQEVEAKHHLEAQRVTITSVDDYFNLSLHNRVDINDVVNVCHDVVNVCHVHVCRLTSLCHTVG